MYNGTNPSALRSKKWITKSLLSLMESKPYQDISVKEITEKSDLARQTFYKVFASKDEVLESYLDSLFSNFLEKLKSEKINSISEIAKLYFSFYEHNEKFIRLLFDNRLSPMLVSRFQIYLPQIRKYIQGDESSMLSKCMEAFISAGLVGILEFYSTHNELSPDEISALLGKMLNFDNV